MSAHDGNGARGAAQAPILDDTVFVIAVGIATIVAFPAAIAGLAYFLLVGA